jgi:hypothetical protein
MYIITAQNWDSVGDYYWIKICIDMILAVAAQGLFGPQSFAFWLVV